MSSNFSILEQMESWLNPANLPRLGDLLAIPFFLLLAAYFASKGLRSLKPLEIVLFLFAVTGAVADIYFTLNYQEEIHSE